MESASCTAASDAQSAWSYNVVVKCEPVKQEPEWGECGVSEAAAAEGLYAGHDVKYEIVIGPELIQQQDVAFSIKRDLNTTEDPFHLELKDETNQPTEGSRCSMTHKEQNSSDDAKFGNIGETSYSHDVPKTQPRNQSDSNIHSGEKPDSCSICNKQFTRQQDLNRHIKTHTYRWNISAKKFTQNTALTAHRMTHVDEKPFSCGFCKMQFRKRSSLTNHRRTHAREEPFSCSVCSKQFTQQEDWNYHLKAHTGRRTFSCDTCDKKFTKSATLTKHKKVHTSVKAFHCVFCKMQFTKKSHLTKHTRTHTGPTCSVCSKQFSNKQTLTRHMRTHTNETLRHMRTRTNETLLTCSMCKKKYTKDNRLTKHTQISKGKKQYACQDCDQLLFSFGVNRTHLYKNKNMEDGVNINTMKLQDAEQKKHLHIWQLSMETTIESLSAHIRQVLGSEVGIEIKQVKPRLEKDYTSFIITVCKEHYEELLKPDVWPLNAELAEWIWVPIPAIETNEDSTCQPGLPGLPCR